jgi:hypothetical protein
MDVPREYVRLGLRFGRLNEGTVDSYVGDPALRREVDAEPVAEPSALAARAGELLRELPRSGLAPDRVAYLSGQLTALERAARRMCGEPMSYLDEVEAYLQVRPQLGHPDEYAAAHDALAELLPGTGGLAERYAEFRRRDRCPPERLPDVVEGLSRALREAVRAAFGLPEGEGVEYLMVTGRPWSAFNHYLGGYRSRVAINRGLPHRFTHLPNLVAHEAYPGHHTESCRKQRGLVDGEGRVEHAVHLVNTPACLVTEGLADLGLRALLGRGWGTWAQEVFADLGLRVDGALLERVHEVTLGLDRVRQDAAILLHDLRWDEGRVVDHLRRWLLVPEESARATMAFVSDPLWRAYTSTYVEGYRLLSAWLDARPPDQSATHRFARLLDEPLTPARLAADLRTPVGTT